jgi:polysaccharide biosynthesis transport protein
MHYSSTQAREAGSMREEPTVAVVELGQDSRGRVFLLVFLPIIVIGALWLLFRSPVYVSTASVLMSAPTAVDDASAPADAEHVAIQQRILMGEDVIGATRQALEQNGLVLSNTGLIAMLGVLPVEDTNLVEMAAQGEAKEQLPKIVNQWIDSYLAVRVEHVEDARILTQQQVTHEMQGLSAQLGEARESLALFRRDNGIISVERQENEVLSQLEGLSLALNRAREEDVKAQASLDSLEQAAERGERVISQESATRVAGLETELKALQAEMAELNRQFTPSYIERQPGNRIKMDRIAQLQREVTAALDVGRRDELGRARQQKAVSAKAVEDLELRLRQHQQIAAEFSDTLATYRAMVVDLEQLEELHRARQSRLAEVELIDARQYPEVSVVQRPAAQAERIGLSLWLQLVLLLAVALVAAVLVVCLYLFLLPKPPRSPYVTLEGVHLYQGEAPGLIASQAQRAAQLARDSARLPDGRQQDTGEA